MALPPYTYEDTFVVNSIEETELRDVEDNAYIDVQKQNVTDEYYIEELVKSLVYMELSIRQAEADGFGEKLSGYKKKYERILRMQRHGDSDSGIFSINIGRA